MPNITDWTLSGYDDQTIFGNTHMPDSEPLGVVLLCHGFKGYKDYGFFPYLAQQFAEAGFVAHRFNFSHSGMTNNIETFERADLFERDTWGAQHYDLLTVTGAVRDGRLAGEGLPIIWFGHSRGGLTVLTAAGHISSERQPRGVIAVASPDRPNNLVPEQEELFRKQGYMVSPSSRTGQDLRIGLGWLEEIERFPEKFDPCVAVGKIDRAVLLVHGSDDPTVPVQASRRIAKHGGARVRLVAMPGANHVFGAPNPMPLDGDVPAHAEQLAQITCAFARGVVLSSD